MHRQNCSVLFTYHWNVLPLQLRGLALNCSLGWASLWPHTNSLIFLIIRKSALVQTGNSFLRPCQHSVSQPDCLVVTQRAGSGGVSAPELTKSFTSALQPPWSHQFKECHPSKSSQKDCCTSPWSCTAQRNLLSDHTKVKLIFI